MATQTEHLYIVRDEGTLGGEPIVKGSRTPVRAVVELWRLGYAPDEIPRELPHLTLAAVFDALSYYADHQAEINGYIQRNRVPDDRVDAHESFEVVRRRLFTEVQDAGARDATCYAFARLYQENRTDFPAECREAEYERRMRASYPIHPEL